jgi:hypothetical protein
LINEQGDVIALVHPSIGNGPFHIVLARPVPFDALTVGESAQWRGNSIQVGQFTVDLSQAKVWDPALPVASIPKSAWSHLRERLTQGTINSGMFISRGTPGDQSPGYKRPAVATALDESGYDLALAERAQQGAEHLLAGLHNDWISDIERGTELLAGLGVGLTPAGDDFLLGFIARIWLEPTLFPPDWTAPDLCQTIARTAGPRTTRLSRAWLDYAARGQFAESWHDLAAALTANDPATIQHATNRILSTGATSGRDAMAGFLLLDSG